MPIEFTRKGRYEVWLNGQKISEHNQEREATETIINHSAVHGDGEYEIKGYLVMARAYGVVSNQDGGDTTPPTTPGSVSSVATSATTGTTSWTASTDNVGVAGYQVFVDGSPVGTTTNLSFGHTGLSPSTQYSVTVTAYDAAGNNSVAGGPALFTTDANSAPVWSLGNQAYETGQSVNIDLDSVCTDADGDTITYSLVSGSLPSGLSLSGTRNETLSGTVDTVEAAVFTLGASDGIAAVQEVALTFTITAPDTTAPDAPTGLSVTSTTSSSVNLDWDDNVESDFNNYILERSTTSASGPWGRRNPLEPSLTVSNYSDTGLNEETDYWYRVRAEDDSGNRSTYSSVVQGTTDAASATTNAARISAILAGRSPHFSYSLPADPITTRQVTVNSASEFNAQAQIAGTQITIGSSFSGNIQFGASDLDIIMDNSLTITGNLQNQSATQGSPHERIRWTGGNIGTMELRYLNDVLFDDLYVTASNATTILADPVNSIGVAGTCNRFFNINSTFFLEGPPNVIAQWSMLTAGTDGNRNNTLFFGNCKFDQGVGQQNTRFMETTKLMLVDCVLNPSGLSGNGGRFHETTDVWIKDSWGSGQLMTQVTASSASPSVANGYFDNFDRYASFYCSFDNDNTGTILNTTLYHTSSAGFGCFPPYTDGGGNSVVTTWNGVFPDSSGVGAIRP